MIEIPGYKIHREIDHSDYCHSYSAIQLNTGKTMVVSILTHSTTEYSALKSFFNDIEDKLAHKQFGVITPIKEFIKTQHHTYIISDLLSNSCQQVYKEKAINIDTIFEHIYKIALSLNLYHQVNFYHGGISLDNIYHDIDNKLTLGLAAFNQNFNKKQDDNFDLNKESYKAPETRVSQSKTCDYYALGVVLFELIFKKKPFIAKNKEQLEQLKNAALINIPHPKYAHLKPIFTALLEPDPIKRLSSAEEFKAIVNHLSIQLPQVSYSIETLDSSQSPLDTTPIENQTTNRISNYPYYLAAFGVIAAVTVFFLMSPNKESINSDFNESITQDIPNTQSDVSSYDSDSIEFDSLVQLAQVALADQQVASSLMAINQALKINPNDINAHALKNKIELELKVTAVMQQANQQIISGNIMSPSKGNAIATYQKLQTILPQGDTRAKQGLKKIGDMYHRLALKQVNLNNAELAKSILQKSMAALPKNKRLKRLMARIKSDEASTIKIQLAEQKRQNELQIKQLNERERQNTLQVKRLADAESEEKEKQQRLEQIERDKQLKIEQQNQALKEFQIRKEKQRQQQLISLYNDAIFSLTDTKLTLIAIDFAFNNLQSLEFLDVSPSKSQSLRKSIDDAYVSLSEYQISVKQYKQAKISINKGLTTNPQNSVLKTLKKRLDKLTTPVQVKAKEPQPIVEENKIEKELPIFGTF